MSTAGPGRARCAIVGGGISGLAAAHALLEAARAQGLDLEIRVLESTSRPGGMIRTEREGRLLLEGGPDQFVTQKPAGLALCRRLGLEDELVRLDPGRSRTQIFRNGRPLPLPDGFAFLIPTRSLPLVRSRLFSWRGRARMLCEPWVKTRRRAPADESLSSFAARRFGHEFLERVAEPVIGGIFTADTDRLSLDMTFPGLRQLELEHGSVLRGMRRRIRRDGRATSGTAGAAGAGFVTLAGGLGRLIERLVSDLPRGTLQLDSKVESLSIDPDASRLRVRVAGRPELAADAVILACPAHVSAEFLARADPDLSRDLSQLDHAPCATVNLLYERDAVKSLRGGFGFFVPRTERLSLLACSYVSIKFPDRAPHDRVLLRAFLGGARHPHVLDHDDDGLARLAHRSLVGLLHIEGEPLFHRTHRFPRSMPQFPVGYQSTLQEILERVGRQPGLFLCGAARGSLGLPDCISTGEQAAHEALAWITAGPAQRTGASERAAS